MAQPVPLIPRLVSSGARARKILGWSIDAGVLAVGLLVLGIYLRRIVMPLPLFAWDEESFLIRALYSAETIARNPFAPAHGNGVFLGLIRIIHGLTADYLAWLRCLNIAAYFGGLAAVGVACTRGLPGRRRMTWLLIACAFPYYRFVVSDLPEGCYVGVLGILALLTAWLYRRRPVAHALAAGVVGAALVLIKPHGLAVIAGLAAVAMLDAVASRQWRAVPLRVAAFAVAFFAAGNLFQWASGQTVASPFTFFIEDFYGGALSGGLAPGAVGLGLLSLFAMLSATALLSGLPLLIGSADIVRRWRRERGAFRLQPGDLVFALLAFSLLATLCMVAIFAMKMAVAPAETKRLWGRYFEFFVPLIWLSASGALERWGEDRRRVGRLACAALLLAGLGGLLLSFHWGIVLFPWDATALTAFFQSDPVRAPVGEVLPFRPLAVGATLAAAAGVALGARIPRVWALYVVVLGLFSTVFEESLMRPMIRQHDELAADMRAAAPWVARGPGPTLALVSDANDAMLAFDGFGGRPYVLLATPAPADLAAFRTLIAIRTQPPPSAEWTRTLRGRQLSVFERRTVP